MSQDLLLWLTSMLGVTMIFVGYPLTKVILLGASAFLGFQWGFTLYSEVLSNWFVSAPHDQWAVFSAVCAASLFAVASWLLYGITLFTAGTTLGFWWAHGLFETAWVSVGLLAVACGIAFTVLARPLVIVASALAGALAAVSLPAFLWGYLENPLDLLLIESRVPLHLRLGLSALVICVATGGAIYQLQHFGLNAEEKEEKRLSVQQLPHSSHALPAQSGSSQTSV
ncbi:MAG: hypothetical protein AAF267_04785 [Deinococcota bacterium]